VVHAFKTRLIFTWLHFHGVRNSVVLCCACINPISICDRVLCYFFGLYQLLQRSGRNSRILPEQTSNPGPGQEERRSNRIVKSKTVPCGTLVFEGPSAGGWDGYSQQIWYAIASARSYQVSPAPGLSWSVPPCQAT
jgi:hypothetical protein